MTSLRRIAGAAVRCWLSTAVIGLGLSVVFDGRNALTWDLVRGIVSLTTLLTGGYGLTLFLARRHFREDANVGGRRDLIAGFLAIVLLGAASTLTQGTTPVVRLTLTFLSGTVSALLMYFPWFQRQPQPETISADV